MANTPLKSLTFPGLSDTYTIDGVSNGIKTALLQLASKVAYIDDQGAQYYQDLYDALYPPADLVSISAVYTQSGTVYDTDTLDSLKPDLVVTATYDDSSTSVITNYTLSGTLTEGTSTITVSYGGKTATFTVTVTHSDVPAGYTAYDYIAPTASLGDNISAYGIWTNAQLSTDYTLEAKIKVISGNTALTKPPLFGTRTGASGAKQIAIFYNNGYDQLGYWVDGTDSSPSISPAPSKDTVHTIKIQPVGASETYPSNITIKVDNTEYSTGSSSTGVTYSQWFGIFQYAISSTGISGNEVKYVGQQIGEILVTDSNNDAVYHFIPAKDQDDRYGFYEKVNGVFYYNSTYAVTGFTGGSWE